jgi:hypothetical protein
MTILRYLILLTLISTAAAMAGDSHTAKELLKSKIDAVITVLQNKKLDTLLPWQVIHTPLKNY